MCVASVCPHRARHDLPLPFFLPPEAFIHTHLPFEPCWQLLPDPVRTADWWRRPGLSLGFAAAGGQLLQASMPEGDGGALTPLKACNVLEVDRCARRLMRSGCVTHTCDMLRMLQPRQPWPSLRALLSAGG